jgi:hypothetical protein
MDLRSSAFISSAVSAKLVADAWERGGKGGGWERRVRVDWERRRRERRWDEWKAAYFDDFSRCKTCIVTSDVVRTS